MVQSAIGSLTVIFNSSVIPMVYWKGTLIAGVKGILINSGEDDDKVIRLKIDSQTPDQDEAYAEMISAGIKIKKVAA